MKKKLLIIIPIAVIIIAVLSAAIFVFSSGLSFSKGVFLAADNGASLFIDEQGSPIRMTDCTKKGNAFEGLETGNEILILHDGIQESYPGGTGVYYARKTAEGSADLIPEETLSALTELGWLKAEEEKHEHSLAAVPQVSEPLEPNGYCGNTVTTFIINGTNYSIMYGNSVAVTDLLRTTVFDPQKLCKCLPEFEIKTEFGDEVYGVNLSEGYVRCSKGQADLMQEQVDLIAKARTEAVETRMILD
ncbi:MAG: hypothetical protein J6A60_04580 [Clostridia bacterium]|nr:hypothetical protein [Clostridia bacterium]